MVDGAGTEVVLISSSPEVLAHHSPGRQQERRIPFASLQPTPSAFPILPLYMPEFPTGTRAIPIQNAYIVSNVTTRFVACGFPENHLSIERFQLVFPIFSPFFLRLNHRVPRRKENEIDSTVVRENPVM